MGLLGHTLSKNAKATYVPTKLGSPLALHAIYRMMVQLDDACIQAHDALCYRAFACLRHVECRLQDMNTPFSAKLGLNAATEIQDHIFWEHGDDRR